ncbi:MAG: DUF6519 domain-containing protein, partial [Elainellaceae cyanobacterium]
VQTVDMIGFGSGAPSVDAATGNTARNSFRIGVVALSNAEAIQQPWDLVIIPGRYYINGILCELELGETFTAQIKQSSQADEQSQGRVTVTVDSLLVDGRVFEVGQWLEQALDLKRQEQDSKASKDSKDTENSQPLDSAAIASLPLGDDQTKAPVCLKGLQIVSIDRSRRELTLDGTVTSPTDTSLLKLRRLTTYRTQPDYPLPKSAPISDGNQVAYLDVWERHITAIDDSEIREPALNVPDTTTRTKTVWQLKLVSEAELQELVKDSPQVEKAKDTEAAGAARDTEEAQGTETTIPEDELSSIKSLWDSYVDAIAKRAPKMNACARLCPDGRNGGSLQSLENHLYRVEIHQAGATPSASAVPAGVAAGDDTGATGDEKTSRAIATFKWSRDNGSITSAISRIEGNVIRIRKTSDDAWASSQKGQWLEITSEANELRNEPGVMVPLVRAIDTKLEFDGSRVINGPLPPNPKTVRRWDHTTEDVQIGSIPVQTTWVDLEAGIRVKFDPDSPYETGDYWMIPSRSGPRDIEWPTNQAEPDPEPIFQPRRGITHHVALLAIAKIPPPNAAPESASESYSGQAYGGSEQASDDATAEQTQALVKVSDERLVFPPLFRALDRAGGTVEGSLDIEGNLSVEGKTSVGDLEVTGDVGANRFQGQTFEIVKDPTAETKERYGLIQVGEGDAPKFIELAVDKATDFIFTSGKVGVGAGGASQFGVLGNAAVGSSEYLTSATIPENGLIVDGQVGIGTPSPDSRFKLHVEGDIFVNGTIEGTDLTFLSNTVSSLRNRDLQFETGGEERLTISGLTGNVGIATTPSATYKLDVDGDLHVGGRFDADGIVQGNGLVTTNGVINSRDNATLRLRTGNAARLEINPQGHVGIGIEPSSNPSNDARLTVHDGVLRISRAIDGDVKFVEIGRSNTSGLEYCDYKTNCTHHFFDKPVTVKNSISSDENNDLVINANDDSQLGLVVFQTNGNVSIGARNVPNGAENAKLYVSGETRIDGPLR